ncbi:MAG TPA: translocation/assembly module TamB domain-containing protein [Gemmatimonadaceae bacterium]
MNRPARIILVSIAALLALVIVAIVVLNGTYFGRERVRTLALDALRDMVHGEVIVGRIDGNLLDRFDLVDVQILDEDGQPFLIADRIRARVAFSPLLSRRIIIRSLEIERPIVTVSKTAGDLWNYERIFQGGDTVKGTPSPGWGSWVDLHGITVLNGTLLVHQPYPADDAVRRIVGDSAAFALARESRVKVERVGSSLRQTMEFRDINARIPRLVFAHPDSTAMSFRVRQLSMLATPLEAPDVVVRNMEGDVRITDDTVSLRGVDLSLPESRIKGGLIYHVSAGDVELDLKSDTLAFADIRAIYPKLPDGGGRLDLKATIRDTSTSEYEFTNARLAVGDSRVAGRLGMAINPSMLELRETDLRFTRFTTELVEALVPGLQVKIPGAFTGRAILSGPSNALTTDVNGTYDPTRHAPFQLTAKGIIGTGDVTSAKNLRLNIRNLPVSLSKEFVAEVPIGGTANIDAVVSGSTASQFTGKATITHREAATSTIIAEGSIAPRDQMRMNLGFRLAPLSLELVERYAPKTDFRGDVRGTGEVHGTLRDLRASVALQLPSGSATVTGTFDLESATRSYNATTQLRDVDINAIVAKMPVTRLNGEATVVGTGTTVRTMDNRVTVHLLDAMVDSTQVSEAVLVAAARNQRLTVDTLRVRTPFAVATGNGTLGLVEGTDGTLTYGIDINTLSGFERWIATGDTTTILPRNFVRQKTVAQATRTDSLPPQVRGDSAIGAILARKPDEQKPVTLPAVVAPGPLRRDSLAGSASVRGTLKGSLPRFSADGRAALNRLVYNGYEIGKGGLDFTWTDVGTKDATITAEMGVDSVRAAGFAFDSTHVQGTYKAGTGDVDLEVFPGDTALYKVRARYALHTQHSEVHLQEVNLRLDSVTWRSVRPSTVRWQDGGIAIDSLDLRSGDGTGRGRIFVNGEVPDADPGRLEIRVDSLRVAPWVTLLQSNVPIDGIASLDATIEGTRSDPRMRGTVALREHNYKRVPFPEIHSAFTYDNRRLQFDGELRRNAAAGNAVMARLKGDVPIDLSLADSVANRKVAGPISIELEGDSIPLSPLADFVEEFSLVTGEARGRVAARGTWDRVHYEGSLAINIPRLGLRTPGVVLTSTVGQLNMVDDRLVIDSLVSHGGGGLTRVTGSVLLADMAHPVVDLKVNADEMRVMDNAKGKLVVSSRLTFKGPVDTLDVNGSLIVMHGIVRIPDPEQWNLINTGDPTLFAITDTALTRELELAPPSPILKNASVDVRLEVRRGTWARSREANIEVFGDLAIERFSGDDEISVTGALHSDYGDYELYGRRFQVTSGSVRFTGPANNPVLQLLATHEVRQAGRAPFDIRVTIGGTLERPNISLESQAQPTLTQSDLISFLAFGQSSTSLLQFDGSAVEGGGLAGSSLSGNVASLATRQLASVALGALFTGLEADLSERTAADVLRIRPAELPSGLSLGDFSTVARGTQIEIGKYLDRNTFFVGQFRATFAVPGATLERRFGTQFRARTSLETRYHPLSPSLTAGLQPKAYQVIAAVLRWTRTW